LVERIASAHTFKFNSRRRSAPQQNCGALAGCGKTADEEVNEAVAR
jgi:hypothetical protein